MTANNVEQDLLARVQRLEAREADLSRPRSGSMPNKRDLLDCRRLSKIQDGQTDVYDSVTGTWVPADLASGGGGIPPFSLPGVPFVSTSGRWYPESTITVVRLFASLAVAGSTATTVALYRNGVSVATVTLGAGDLAEGVALSSTFTGPETDWMQVGVTAVGAGASDLTVQPS